MLILLKIGIFTAFGILFFSATLVITNIFKNRKKKLEEKTGFFGVFKQIFKNEIKGVPPAPIPEKLPERIKKKYRDFNEVFPQYSYTKYRLFKMLFGLSLFFLLMLIFNIIFGVAGFILGRNIVDMIPRYIIKKRRHKFELQLVDGLTLIANGLKAGSSFPQAVEVMVKETKPPLSEVFDKFLKETQMGASVETALDNLSARENSEELKIAVVSINIARQAGGNLSEILFHTADTIRERERIKGKVESLTAQGKMSGLVVGSLPLGLAGILYLVDPIMMGPLFHTFIGQMVMLFVILMEFAGFKWINKIVNIDI